jgi:hypothetical protein
MVWWSLQVTGILLQCRKSVALLLKMKMLCVIALPLLFLTACATTQKSGDLGAYLEAEIKVMGGKDVSRDKFPNLRGTWTAKRSKEAIFEGTVIFTENIAFEGIDNLLRQWYGLPVNSGTTPENQQQWTIPAKIAGCSIWYSKQGDGVRIIVLKPTTFR